MKAKAKIIFFIAAIIACFFMISVYLFSYFVNPIEYEDTFAFGAGIIALLSLSIYNYLDKGNVSLALILPFSVMVIAFIVSFINFSL